MSRTNDRLKGPSFQAKEHNMMSAHVAIVYSPGYCTDLGGLEKLHCFDINKYGRIYDQLRADGVLGPEAAAEPEEVSEEDIRLVHTEVLLKSLEHSHNIATYLEAPYLAMLPISVLKDKILKPFRHATGGTILAGRLALECGIAVNLGGGYHHAKPSDGGGFNVYNDLAIAIRKLQSDGLLRRALVVDLDVHQGNGTAVVFADDDDVFTFSMHDDSIFPIPKARSSLDVGLAIGTDDETYLGLLKEHLPAVFDEARPEMVLYQAGCDTIQDDPLANLSMTQTGIVERDAMVIDACVEHEIPVAMTLGGGYAPDSWHVQYASIRNLIETYGLKD